MRNLSLFLAIVLAATSLLPTALADDGGRSAELRCIQHVDDAGQTTMVCIDPRDPDCVVLIREMHHDWQSHTCVAPVDPGVAIARIQQCWDFPYGLEQGFRVCVDSGDTDCLVLYESWAGMHHSSTCYPDDLLQPKQAGCMDRYQRSDIGPVTYESRSSCEHQVYAFGQPLLG